MEKADLRKPNAIALTWLDGDKSMTQAYVDESDYQQAVHNYLNLRNLYDQMKSDIKTLHEIHTGKTKDRNNIKLSQIEDRHGFGEPVP